jgi:hypothetical protein
MPSLAVAVDEATDHFRRALLQTSMEAKFVDANVGELGHLLHFEPEALGVLDGLVRNVNKN